MKTKLSILALSTSLLLPAWLSADPVSVATDPVGYVTNELPSHVGGSSTCFIANFSLKQEVLLQSTILGISDEVLSVSADLVTGEFDDQDSQGRPLYFVQLLTGDFEGLKVPILSNNENQIILTDSIPSSEIGESFSIQKFRTLSDLFGSDNSVFNLHSAGTFGASDGLYLIEYELVNGQLQGEFSAFYYQTAPPQAGGTGWRRQGITGVDASDTIVEFNTVLFSRNGSTTRPSIQITNTGRVQLVDQKTPITKGMNLLGLDYPLGATLGTLGLDPSDLLSGGTAGTSDVVYIVESDNSLQAFYYQSAPPQAGGTGWRRVGDTQTDRSEKVIEPNQGVLILKRNAGDIYLSNNLTSLQ